MDLDAVLARHPQVAVVDEIAHTNAPGSRNRKRYQDVLELLDAGINVICAFNVQHLESLKDVVERATGVVIRETVPDSFLKQADQVVNLDLDAEDLLERLRAGKIYDRRQGRVGARRTSSRRTSCRACASWRCARWPSGSTRRPASAAARRREPRAGDRRAGDGVHGLVLAARRRAAAPRLAPGRPAQHRLVRRLRRDARTRRRPASTPTRSAT